MAKFYQHLEPGDNLGKVTQLDYIDDISDDDLILYRFKDGTACSKEFIAAPDEMNAGNGKYVMVELFSATTQWKIEQKEVSLGDETRTYTDPETGITYEIPVPGVQENGVYGGKDAHARPGSIRVTATPPTFFGKKTTESDDNYILSQHPELISGTKQNTNTETSTLTKVSNKPLSDLKEVDTESYIVNSDILTEDTSVYLSYSQDVSKYFGAETSILDTLKTPNVYITYKSCVDNIDKFIITGKNGNEYTFTPDEFFGIIERSQELMNVVAAKVKESEVLTPSQARNKDIITIENYLSNEDVLITNLIEKSKKLESEIGMDITLALPPKEVYNTVKTVYPENMNEDFIKSLAYRIPIQSLINAIAQGLYVYYDGTEKTATTEN